MGRIGVEFLAHHKDLFKGDAVCKAVRLAFFFEDDAKIALCTDRRGVCNSESPDTRRLGYLAVRNCDPPRTDEPSVIMGQSNYGSKAVRNGAVPQYLTAERAQSLIALLVCVQTRFSRLFDNLNAWGGDASPSRLQKRSSRRFWF